MPFKHKRFRPLIWGYLWNLRITLPVLVTIEFPSPNLGLSLKFMPRTRLISSPSMFPSPNLGLSLKLKKHLLMRNGCMSFRPLIWGYLWNVISLRLLLFQIIFRPLIWGYLWNSLWLIRLPTLLHFPSPNLGLSLKCWFDFHWFIVFFFPSPNLGLSLKLISLGSISSVAPVFRPLIWGYLWN